MDSNEKIPRAPGKVTSFVRRKETRPRSMRAPGRSTPSYLGHVAGGVRARRGGGTEVAGCRQEGRARGAMGMAEWNDGAEEVGCRDCRKAMVESAEETLGGEAVNKAAAATGCVTYRKGRQGPGKGKGMATESWPRANLCSLPPNSLLVHYIVVPLFSKVLGPICSLPICSPDRAGLWSFYSCPLHFLTNYHNPTSLPWYLN